MKCSEFEHLLDYLEGHLLGEARESMEAHLRSGCPDCEASRAWFERVREIWATDKTIEPPAWMLDRAVRGFTAAGVRGSSAAAGAVTGVVRLVFDSLKQPVGAGARSARPGDRRLLYAIDDYSVDLQINAAGERMIDLDGQVLCAAEPGFGSVARVPVVLVRAEEQVQVTITNAIGEFRMREIDLGEYDLQIDTRDMTINVQGLPL